MPIESIDTWSQFGLNGMIIAALFALIVYQSREHKEERQEWIRVYKESHQEWIRAYQETQSQIDLRQAETNTVIRTLVAALEKR